MMRAMERKEPTYPHWEVRFDMTDVNGKMDIYICDGFNYQRSRPSTGITGGGGDGHMISDLGNCPSASGNSWFTCIHFGHFDAACVQTPAKVP